MKKISLQEEPIDSMDSAEFDGLGEEPTAIDMKKQSHKVIVKS